MNSIKEFLASAKNEKERKQFIKKIKDNIQNENKKYHAGHFESIPVQDEFKDKIVKIFRDNKYLVQIYNQDGTTRLSINRTEIDNNGDWLQGISWDQLMSIKSEVGYGVFEAVEVYPRDKDVVNVANIRHLFILNETLDFIWKKT
jgi:c-di-AMP phosphodiesterase-like protein